MNQPTRHFGKLLLFMTLLIGMGVVALLPVTHTQAQTNASWSGFFYNSFDLTGTPVQAFFPTGLNKNWGTQPPTDGSNNIIPGISNDFSARLSTSVTLEAGLYEFIVTYDDGARLIINNQLIFDDFQAGTRRTTTSIINIEGGQYNITIEYVDFSAEAVLQAGWVISSGTPQATTTPEPLATGRVVQVQGLSVRTGPFLGASRAAVARPGNDYPILLRNTQEGLFTWYLIQYDIDTVGWVSGRYFDISGNIDAVPFENTTIYDEVPNPPGTVYGVTRSVMNFRVHPSERVARVAAKPQLDWGDEVVILSRTIQGGQPHWYQVAYRVRDSDSDPTNDVILTGWIFAPFVGITSDSDPIETVPIR